MSKRDVDDQEGFEAESGGMSFDWKEYYHALRERLWLILLFALGGTLIAFYTAGKTAPVYASRATLLIEQSEDRVIDVQEVRKEDFGSPQAIATMLETLVSRTMMERLVTRLKLETDFVFIPKPEGREANTKEQAMAVARGCFQIKQRQGTRLIDITAEHADPETARKLADELAAEFLRFQFEMRNNANQMANQFLLEEANRLREKLTRSELALQEYRESQDAISLERDQDVVISRFRSLASQVDAARTQRLQLESDLGATEKVEKKLEELIKLPSISTHPTVSALLKELRDKEYDLSLLSQRYKPKHPKYLALQVEIEKVRGNIPDAISAAASAISNQLASARQNEERLVAELKEQEKKTYGLGKLQVEYDALKREIETDRALYESLLARFKETDLAMGLEKTPVKMVEGAVASYTPVRPDRQKMITQGSLGGLALGLVLALALHLMDSSVKTVAEAESLLGAPVLGAVTIRKSSARKNPAPDLDTVHQQHGPVAESFRYLRSALMLLGKQEDRRTIMFTSAVPAEGKTFCASNYAVTLAQQGLRTLLMDADLRKPTLGEVFLESAEKPGVTDVLVGRVDVKDAIEESTVPNLSVLPAGSRAPNPSELLSGPDFARLIEQMAGQFDRVVIDTAPILAVSDPLLVVPLVSTVCLVVRAHKTPRQAVQRASAALAKTGRKPSGIILNRLPANSGGYYYYYYSGHYGRKGVYGAPRTSG